MAPTSSMREPSRRNRLMSELLYIPEHLMHVEARTSLGCSPRQITMSDDLSIRKHLMEDGLQVSQSLRLSRRAGVAGQSVLVQPALIADANGTMVVRHSVSAYFQQHPVLRHRTVTTDIEVISNLAEITRTKIKRSIFFE